MQVRKIDKFSGFVKRTKIVVRCTYMSFDLGGAKKEFRISVVVSLPSKPEPLYTHILFIIIFIIINLHHY
jgi:hypothetical protein